MTLKDKIVLQTLTKKQSDTIIPSLSVNNDFDAKFGMIGILYVLSGFLEL